MSLSRIKTFCLPRFRLPVLLLLWVIALLPALHDVNYRLLKQRYSNKAAVNHIGFWGYLFYDLWSFAKREITISRLYQVDPAPYAQFLASRRNYSTPSTAMLPAVRKNVILFQLESIDAALVDADYKGAPVMPFLRSLKSKSLYFPNAFDLTGPGRTSDAEFLVLTSQVPIANESVYIHYNLDRIPSLPKVLALNGYDSFSIHAFNGEFWNRQLSHPRLGFRRSFFLEDLQPTETIGWGISDHAFIPQVVQKLKECREPCLAFMILLSNHHPFNHIADMRGIATRNIVEDYFVSANYTDSAIRLMFEALEKEGLLERSLIAIYGDHDPGISLDIQAALGRTVTNSLAVDKVPIFLYGVARPRTLTYPAALYELAPSILYELGIPAPLTFLGHPAQARGHLPVLLQNNLQLTRIRPDGRPRLVPTPLDMTTLTRLAIFRPAALLPEDKAE